MRGFSPERLVGVLRAWPRPQAYLVALSGGRDSAALLAALHAGRATLGVPIRAAHVDHGLHPESPRWGEACAERCAELAIPMQRLRIDARAPPGESPEDWARRHRYQALERVLGTDEMLLTAHHRDDQAETLLLQLLRGAGPRGLAAMPRLDRYGRGWLARPLLECSRQELAEYAERAGLGWIEDPSNSEPRYDRNFLRARVLPTIKQRWPGFARTLARAAGWQRDAAQALAARAAQDLYAARTEGGTLAVSTLRRLDTPRQREVLRLWIRAQGRPLPSAAHVEAVLRTVLGARWDRSPCVRWEGAELRRYRDGLYLMPPLPAQHRGMILIWDPAVPLSLPLGRLRAEQGVGTGIRAALCAGSAFTVRFRQGGERVQLASSPYTRPLKRLLQEAAVPPWLRERLPMLYLGADLAAIPGLGVANHCAARAGEPALRCVWDMDDAALSGGQA
ncbi:MAG: tRNA lysidine(34) synthetase TilS [Gammaproteobacteria bacterium]